MQMNPIGARLSPDVLRLLLSFQALEVSDHYPVEVLLKDSAHTASFHAATPLSLLLLSHFGFQMFTC